MNKTELIAAVAEKATISKKDAENAVSAVIASIIRVPRRRREGSDRRFRHL